MTFRIHVYTGSLLNPMNFPTITPMEFYPNKDPWTSGTNYNYKRIGSFVDWFRRTAFDLPGRTKSFERSAGEVEFSEVGGFVFSDDILSTDEIGDVIVFGSQAKEINWVTLVIDGWTVVQGGPSKVQTGSRTDTYQWGSKVRTFLDSNSMLLPRIVAFHDGYTLPKANV